MSKYRRGPFRGILVSDTNARSIQAKRKMFIPVHTWFAIGQGNSVNGAITAKVVGG